MVIYGFVQFVVILVVVELGSCTEREKDRIYTLHINEILSLGQNGNTVQKSTKVADRMDCTFACNDEMWCKSINFKTSPESDGNHICELLSSNRYDNSTTTSQNSNFVHYNVETLCDTQTNCSQQQCQLIDNEKNFKCAEFNGKRFHVSGSGRFGSVQTIAITVTGVYRIRAGGARGGTHTYNYGYNPGTYYGGKGAVMEGWFKLTAPATLNVVVGQRGGNSVEVSGGTATTATAASLGKSIEDNAGTGGGGGSFVYTASNTLLIAAGGGGGASSGHHGVDGQSGTSGTASKGTDSAKSRGGGVGGNPGVCNTQGGNYHGGVGAGWLSKGCDRLGVSHGERGGSRLEAWVGGQAGKMNSGQNGGPAPGAVGGFGGGGGGSEDNGASGGGGGYSGGGSGTYNQQAGGGGGSYCSGSSCNGVTGGNTDDDGFVEYSLA